jgi:hypothetical protein
MSMSLVQLTRFTIAAVLVAAAGCGHGDTSTGHDAGPEAGTSGSGTGGSDAGNTCGQCAPGAPFGWTDPGLVWFGAEKDAPSCPDDAPSVAYEGHADLSGPIDCGTCTCTPPTGSCTLPATMTANAATCALNNASTPHTPFDPSSGWTGACDASVAIGSGKLCSGVDCVQSLTIGPLGVKDSGGCMPSQPPAQSSPMWQMFARACRSVPHFSCEGGAGSCLAMAPPAFRACVYREGDHDCLPPTAYTEKHVFYDAFQDTRACSPCTCGTPSGSTCSATVSIYTDGACSTLAYSATIDATGPACHNLPPGSPLGSKLAGSTNYTAGACTPGASMPTGAATPTGPSTLCCLPAP